jgi:hypothetical protein
LNTRILIVVTALTLVLTAPLHAQAPIPTAPPTPQASPTSSFGPDPTVAVATPVTTSNTGYVEGAPVVVTGWGAGAQGAFYAILASMLMLGGIQCVLLFWIFIRR